ncbi:hypothetical protein SAMN05421780_1258, partial [Flexibacter flexilis DSM 6793]
EKDLEVKKKFLTFAPRLNERGVKILKSEALKKNFKNF